MDKDASIHSERRSDRTDSHDTIHKVEFREFDLKKDTLFLSELYWQFCFDVNQEDLSGSSIHVIDGAEVEVFESQARIYGYLSAGCRIQCAFVNGVLAGFLIFHEIFDRIVVIRAMFIDRWAHQYKLGKGLINSLQKIPNTILFQTRKQIEPDRCLKVTESHRSKIAEDEHFITWSMTWRSDGLQYIHRTVHT